MPENRKVATAYGVGGYDPTKPNNNIIEEVTKVISDEELAIEAVEQETAAANDQALVAYKNYNKLSPAAKDIILKGLLGDFISRNRSNYI